MGAVTTALGSHIPLVFMSVSDLPWSSGGLCIAVATLSTLDGHAIEEDTVPSATTLVPQAWFGQGLAETHPAGPEVGETARKEASSVLVIGSTVTLRGGNSNQYCNADKCQSAQVLTFEVVDAGSGLVALKAGGCWDTSGGNRVTCRKGTP